MKIDATLNTATKRKAEKVARWWAKLRQNATKKRCISCGGKYPCDDHSVDP